GYRVHVFTADAAALLPARPRLRARLDWRHTLALARQSPRAVAVDDQLGQLYVAAQAILPDEGEDEGDLGARLYVFDTATHDLLTALDAFRNPADIALSLLGDLVFLAADELPLGDGEAGPGIAVFREEDLRSDAAPAGIIALDGPARLAVSPRTGALFALLPENDRLVAWSEDQIRDWLPEDPGDTPPTSGPENPHELTFSSPLTNPDALRGPAVLHVTQDGRFLFLADLAEDGGTPGLRVVDVAELFSDAPAELLPAVA